MRSQQVHITRSFHEFLIDWWVPLAITALGPLLFTAAALGSDGEDHLVPGTWFLLVPACMVAAFLSATTVGGLRYARPIPGYQSRSMSRLLIGLLIGVLCAAAIPIISVAFSYSIALLLGLLHL
jgi:hypothetical protein